MVHVPGVGYTEVELWCRRRICGRVQKSCRAAATRTREGPTGGLMRQSSSSRPTTIDFALFLITFTCATLDGRSLTTPALASALSGRHDAEAKEDRFTIGEGERVSEHQLETRKHCKIQHRLRAVPPSDTQQPTRRAWGPIGTRSLEPPRATTPRELHERHPDYTIIF